MTSAIDHRVHTAQSELDSAREAQRKAKRLELAQKLADARKQLREAHATYERLALEVKTEREQRALIQGKLNHAFVAVDDSWRERPAVAAYLPDDPEVVAWQRQHTALVAERDKLIAERNAIPRADFVEASRYEGPSGLIARLEHAEASLLAQLDGSLATSPRGGLSAV